MWHLFLHCWNRKTNNSRQIWVLHTCFYLTNPNDRVRMSRTICKSLTQTHFIWVESVDFSHNCASRWWLVQCCFQIPSRSSYEKCKWDADRKENSNTFSVFLLFLRCIFSHIMPTLRLFHHASFLYSGDRLTTLVCICVYMYFLSSCYDIS